MDKQEETPVFVKETTPTESLSFWSESKIITVSLVALAYFIWATIIIVGFVYMARSSRTGGEKFRLSLGFALVSVFFPPFAVVPIVLNAH